MTAMVVLHRGPLKKESLVTLTRFEEAEASTLVHEIGHWLGVPARDNHSSATSKRGKHCNHGACVMFKGTSACTVLANLAVREPTRFCPACAAELAEMARGRGQPLEGGVTPLPGPPLEPGPPPTTEPAVEVTEVRATRNH